MLPFRAEMSGTTQTRFGLKSLSMVVRPPEGANKVETEGNGLSAPEI